eukprot:scaffold122034_cov32-Tisochrysis_lutea.AAC.3
MGRAAVTKLGLNGDPSNPAGTWFCCLARSSEQVFSAVSICAHSLRNAVNESHSAGRMVSALPSIIEQWGKKLNEMTLNSSSASCRLIVASRMLQSRSATKDARGRLDENDWQVRNR